MLVDRAMAWQPSDRPSVRVPGFSMAFGSSDMSTRRALRELGNHLAAQGLDAARRDTIQIVMAEALNNVTEHAYAGRVGPVRMECYSGPDRLEIVVRDRGTPPPASLVSGAGVVPPDPAGLPEGGFGWHLIRSLTGGLRHIRSDDRNELWIVFNLP